ncbi:MAG: hypothetical protein VYE15_02945 [Myxococcota bacterium]|nr:hypothetical protein [Myxococcota bacterium]
MFRPRPRFIEIKPSQRFIFALVTLCLVTFATPSLAEGQAHVTAALQDRPHSVTGVLLENQFMHHAALAYEYGLTDRFGIRADLGMHLSVGEGLLYGGVGVTYLPTQTITRDARHSLEITLMPMGFAVGRGQCDDSVPSDGESVEKAPCRFVRGFGVKSIAGYRYQQHTGFQARIGLSRVDGLEGDGSSSQHLSFVQPELYLGWAF